MTDTRTRLRPRAEPVRRHRRSRAVPVPVGAATLLLAMLAVLAPVLGWGVAAPGDASATEPGSVAPPSVGVPPVDPLRVVRGFAPPAQQWSAGPRGVDLLGTEGAPVRAALSGVVSFTGPVAGRPVVSVTSGALRTTYEPVVATVREGEQVGAGQPLGRLAATPSHCPPRVCLHWGLLRDRTYLDPMALLVGAPPRLLPVPDPPPRENRVPPAPNRFPPQVRSAPPTGVPAGRSAPPAGVPAGSGRETPGSSERRAPSHGEGPGSLAALLTVAGLAGLGLAAAGRLRP